MLREQGDRECALSTRAIDDQRKQHEVELDSLRREISLLRGELAVDRGLQALRDEIAVAKSQVPEIPDIEARVETKLFSDGGRAVAITYQAGEDP